MTYNSKRPPLDEDIALYEATIAREGATTAAGAAAGNSIIDAGLIGAGVNSFINMTIVLYPGQPLLVDSMSIVGFNNVTGEITLEAAYKSVAAAIPAGVRYKICSSKAASAIATSFTSEMIFYDSILGIPGVVYPAGTAQYPSDTIADVITLCNLRNIRRISVRGVLVLGAAMNAYRFDGYKHLDIAHTVNLNGQDVSVSSFNQLIITGAQGGAGLVAYNDCMLLSMTGFNGVATLCGLITAITLAAATSSGFIDCYSYLGTCTINLGSPTVANFVNLAGSFILANQTAGTTNIWADKGCEIVINASCTGGTINIYGNAIVTNNAAAGCTVNQYTLDIRQDQIQGGAFSLEGAREEFAAQLDLAEVRTLTSPTPQLTVAYQYVYTNSPGRPFYFAGGFMNRASGGWAGGEIITIIVQVAIAPATWITVWSISFAAEPNPVLAAIPCHANSALLNLPYGFYNRGDGVRVGISQNAIGGGWHTWNHSFLDAPPGT